MLFIFLFIFLNFLITIFIFNNSPKKTIIIINLILIFTIIISLILIPSYDSSIDFLISDFDIINSHLFIPWKKSFLKHAFVIVISIISIVFIQILFKHHKYYFKEFLHNAYYLYLIFIFSYLGIIGAIYTSDFFNFYIFIEICTLAFAVIISVNTDKQSLIASIKYLIYNTLISSIILLLIGLWLLFTHNLYMPETSMKIDGVLYFICWMIGVLLVLKLGFITYYTYIHTNPIILIYLSPVMTITVMYFLLRNNIFIINDYINLIVIIFCILGIYKHQSLNFRQTLLYSNFISIYFILLIITKLDQFEVFYFITIDIITKFSIFFVIIESYYYELNNEEIKIKQLDFETLHFIKSSKWHYRLMIISLLSNIGLPMTVGFNFKFKLLEYYLIHKNLSFNTATIIIAFVSSAIYNWNIIKYVYCSNISLYIKSKKYNAILPKILITILILGVFIWI